jgi:polysaccharide deacetylase family protein (PEP-CTERM system associated)
MLNALTVDVEEHFHVEAFASCVARESWDGCASRVERNTDRVLEIFDRHNVRATFFVMGWVAERHAALVRRIAAAGHEIGCHSYAHQRIHRQPPEEFRADVRRARRLLEEHSGGKIACYRAPSFSIVRKTLWALDILAEEGFRIDSSIFPVRHDLYGIPDAKRFPHWGPTGAGTRIFEFPPSTIRRFGNNWGVGGGGWLRLFPYHFTRTALQSINNREGMPAMVYLHPWELDPAQPRIAAPLRSRVRHYTNLSRMQEKLERLLGDFRFAGLSEVCRGIPAYQNGDGTQ